MASRTRPLVVSAITRPQSDASQKKTWSPKEGAVLPGWVQLSSTEESSVEDPDCGYGHLKKQFMTCYCGTVVQMLQRFRSVKDWLTNSWIRLRGARQNLWRNAVSCTRRDSIRTFQLHLIAFWSLEFFFLVKQIVGQVMESVDLITDRAINISSSDP